MPILPDEDNKILKFKNIQKTIRCPLVYYVDLEAVLRKVDSKNRIQKHEACSYSFLALSEFYKNSKIYTGNSAKDTINNFIKSLIEEGKKKIYELLLKRIEEFKLPQLNDDEILKYNNSTKCHFCNKELAKAI